jgi:hypothetical protein
MQVARGVHVTSFLFGRSSIACRQRMARQENLAIQAIPVKISKYVRRS